MIGDKYQLRSVPLIVKDVFDPVDIDFSLADDREYPVYRIHEYDGKTYLQFLVNSIADLDDIGILVGKFNRPVTCPAESVFDGDRIMSFCDWLNADEEVASVDEVIGGGVFTATIDSDELRLFGLEQAGSIIYYGNTYFYFDYEINVTEAMEKYFHISDDHIPLCAHYADGSNVGIINIPSAAVNAFPSLVSDTIPMLSPDVDYAEFVQGSVKYDAPGATPANARFLYYKKLG